MVSYCLRQVLMDSLTLEEYERAESVSWESIKWRLIQNERKINYHITDNHLWAVWDSYKANSLDDIFVKALPKLSLDFLELHSGSLYVKSNMFSKWQELITFCPPLVIVAIYAANNSINIDHIQYTAILPPYIKELEEIKKLNQGFNDLHIHLNGSTETDVLWQEVLLKPKILIKYFEKALIKKTLVREQKEQELVIRDSNHLFELLKRARALRYYFANYYLSKSDSFLSYPISPALRDNYDTYLDPDTHPYQEKGSSNTDLNNELRMLIDLFLI